MSSRLERGQSRLGGCQVRSTHDLLDYIRARVEVDQSLVDPHLVSIPSLRTFSTRSEADHQYVRVKTHNGKGMVGCLSPRYMKNEIATHVLRVVCLRILVGRRTGPLTRSSRSLARLIRSPQTDLEIRSFRWYRRGGSVRTLFERLDVTRGESDADLMDLGTSPTGLVQVVFLHRLRASTE